MLNLYCCSLIKEIIIRPFYYKKNLKSPTVSCRIQLSHVPAAILMDLTDRKLPGKLGIVAVRSIASQPPHRTPSSYPVATRPTRCRSLHSTQNIAFNLTLTCWNTSIDVNCLQNCPAQLFLAEWNRLECWTQSRQYHALFHQSITLGRHMSQLCPLAKLRIELSPEQSNYCVPVSEVTSRQQLRSASRHQLLLIPRYRYRLRTFGRRASAVAGPTFWNSLADELRTYCSDRFKLALKTFLRLFATY